MSAGGKTDRADSAGIDAVIVRVFAHELDRPLYVFELGGVMSASLGDAVAQYESRNAECVESLCSAVPFVIHTQVVIASAGTNDERASVCVFGFAHKHNRIAVSHTPYALPQKNGAAGSGEGKGGKDNKERCAYISARNGKKSGRERWFFIHGKNLP